MLHRGVPLKIRRIDGSRINRALIALITSKEFLAKVSTRLRPHIHLFSQPYVKATIEWCLDHYEKYNTPLDKDILAKFQEWAASGKSEDETEAYETFLSHLSKQFDDDGPLNIPFYLDELQKLVLDLSQKQHMEEVAQAKERGDINEADKLIVEYKRPQVYGSSGVDILHDVESWKPALSSAKKEAIIKFPGDAGKFFNRILVRGGFVAIQGIEKQGKSHFCVEFAVQALRQRRRVAFFETGDLDQEELIQRFGVRISGRPLENVKGGFLEVPAAITLRDGDGDEEDLFKTESDYDTETKRIDVSKPLKIQDVSEILKKFNRAYGLKGRHLMIDCQPSGSMNVKSISAKLDEWLKEFDWAPDLIVVDYPDILGPEKPHTKEDFRNNVNETWMALRWLSQTRRALVIAPTQGRGRGLYSEGKDVYRLQTMNDFSEDKRKYSHTTATIGLNQNIKERKQGTMRLNMLVVRRTGDPGVLYTGTCFGLGKCFTCATLRSWK